MRKLTALTLGAIVFSFGLGWATGPASALGGCGPNMHRNFYGYCVWGGQNQAWCLRNTGHVAGYGPYGSRWCR